jgi:hypothetical protein
MPFFGASDSRPRAKVGAQASDWLEGEREKVKRVKGIAGYDDQRETIVWVPAPHDGAPVHLGGIPLTYSDQRASLS